MYEKILRYPENVTITKRSFPEAPPEGRRGTNNDKINATYVTTDAQTQKKTATEEPPLNGLLRHFFGLCTLYEVFSFGIVSAFLHYIRCSPFGILWACVRCIYIRCSPFGTLWDVCIVFIY